MNFKDRTTNIEYLKEGPVNSGKDFKMRKLREMTPLEFYNQGVSFVYGNLHASNSNITREGVERAFKELLLARHSPIR